jgi:hypothetical protein
VPLKDEHTFAAINREEGGRREAANPGTDDNRVPGIGECKLFVRRKFHREMERIER